MNDTTSSQKMLLISLIIFVLVFIYFVVTHGSNNSLFNWFIRVVVSLAAASMSMSLSGSINIGNKKEMRTFAEESPNISAAGSFAVFVIVYLFNPIG